MKKFFAFAVLAAMTLGLASCKKDAMNVDPSTLDNTTNKCWHFTETATVYGIKVSDDGYVWCTERQLVETLQMAKGTGVKATYEQASASTEEACDKLNSK